MSELDPIVEKIDAIPEPLRPFYKQQDGGKFVLSVKQSEGYALENVAGLRATLQDQKLKHDKAQAALKAFEGLDAAKAREALTLLESGKLKGDDAVQAMRKELEAKLAEKDGEINRFRQAERNRSVSSAIDGAIAGRQEIPAELRPLVRQMFADYIGVDDSGKVGVWNADKTAFRLTSKGSDYSAAMSAEEFIESAISAAANGKAGGLLSADHAAMLPALMRASGKSGSGATGNAVPPGSMSREQFAKLTATEKAKAINANPALASLL